MYAPGGAGMLVARKKECSVLVEESLAMLALPAPGVAERGLD
jgi:hypothetical protein